MLGLIVITDTFSFIASNVLSVYNTMGNFYKKDLDILKELNKNNKNTNSDLSSKGASIMSSIF